MNKHCGPNKLLTFLVAAIFSLALAAPDLSFADSFVNHSRATAGADKLNVGDGVLKGENSIGLCWQGLAGSTPDGKTTPGPCGVLPEDGGHINLILGDNLSFSIDQAPGLLDALWGIFVVPDQNLLSFDPSSANPGLTGANFKGAWKIDGDHRDELPLDPPITDPAYSSFVTELTGNSFVVPNPNAFTESSDDIKTFLGLPGPNNLNSNNWSELSHAMYDVPATLANNGLLEDLQVFSFLEGLGILSPGTPAQQAAQFISYLLGDYNGNPANCLSGTPLHPGENTCISGFHVFLYQMGVKDMVGEGDVVHLETMNIPLGTIVTAWGKVCDEDPTTKAEINCSYLAPPITRTAIMMPLGPQAPPEVPEPTTLLLLGTGLVGIGRQLRKRQRKSQDQTTV